jgi:protein-S-isoprenylcysteine O-methyltransferase Ste14
LETPFRIALAAVIVLTMSIGSYHRIQAARSGEKISHRDEGYLFALVLRLTGLALWAAVLAYLISPASIAWAQLPLPVWVRWIGVAAGLLCSLLMYWTMSSLGKNLTDTVVTRADATLVTHGPYRYVRHPFYITAALLMGSAALITASGLVGLAGALIITLLVVRTSKEEARLIDKFGQPYRDYMATTGRFFPRLGRPSA